VISDIDANKLAAVEQEIKAVGGDALSVAGDVGADDFPKRIVDATVAYVYSYTGFSTHRVSNRALFQEIRENKSYC
jgi:hypothetical protein